MGAVEETSLEGDRPPDLSPEELEKVDLESDIVELTRLEKNGSAEACAS